jgi:uncharacterized protein (DUF305 family)
MAISFKVNVSPVSVDAPKDTSLIWVIRERLERTGTLLTSRLLRRTSFGNAREERPVALERHRSVRPYALVIASVIAVGAASAASAQEPSHQGLGGASPTSASANQITSETPFLKANDAAMAKMIKDMTVKPTGDVDRDFVAMMIPHHQGAIDMSEAELSWGHNQQLLRIAQEIVAEELQEIAAMRAALGEKLTPSEAALVGNSASASAPARADRRQPSLEAEKPFLGEDDAAMTKMMKDMAVKPTGDVDRDFVAMMVPHHQGAIDMAQAELRYGHDARLKRIAQEIIVDQIAQISLMRFAVGEPLPPSVSSPTNPTVPSQTGGQAGSPTREQPPMKMDGAMRMSPGPSEPQAGDL